ncbi:trichohyalin-like [Drosophila ananassae]|uniref:trichohyalin-like n=1 Tax=Drosophila ananassae TaxID=7217 RepID=UPI001CFFA5BC|nr:trichohyalin-like [Drosophila ananassae]
MRNSQHIANVRANNPEYREESRAQDATARAHRRRSERIRNLERIRDAEAHADRRQNLDYRVPERNRDMEARAARREDPEERRREQVQDTARHVAQRTIPDYRIPERIRDMEARATRPRAYHRQDSEEHAREQERNTEEHRQRRRNPEERQREREMDANNRRAIRRNPIARSQEQRMNTSQRRETRQQRRIREEQIRQMAEDRLINFRMDPQNRLDASQRQSQRNMDARAALSEDEMEQERELQRHRIRSSARDLYHRNIKEGPTEICVCCGGTWFRSQDYDEANDLEVDVEDEVAEQNYPLMDGSGYVKKRKHPLILRWVRFSINSSPSDYFREHLMLFYPWRNEEAELLSNDVENTFRTNHESIRIMKRNYDVFDDMELERVLEDLQEDRRDNNPNLEEPASQFLDEEFRALAVPNIERNEQRRRAALNRSRARYEENNSQIRMRNSQHIANVRANNPEYREESRAQDATARAHRRRSERIRNLERIRDAEAHADRRQNLDYRVPERNRDMEARAARREDPEERRREQRRIREEQIRQMAEDRLINFRMDPQNRLDASQRQSQRNMDARAALSEDEMEQERELQRHRIRSSARDLYHRNIKEGPTEICVCCGGTWFRSQDYDEANDLEVDVEDEVAEQNYPLMDGSGYVKKRKHPLILRWVRFSINSSPSDYFREHLMLFYPWRNEEAELLSNDVENTFRTNHESIRIMKRNYDVFDDMELERVLEDLQEDRRDNNPNLEEPASQFLDEEFRALAVPNIERNVNILQDDNATNNPEEDGELQLIRLPPVEDQSMLLLTENNSQLFLLRLLPSIKAKEQHIAKSQCILKEALNELRYMLDAVEPLAHRDFSF